MYKVLKCFFAAVIAAAVLCGCTEVDEERPIRLTETTVEIELPYPVTVGSLTFEDAPKTVGSLSPAITEIICELGYGDKLIGRSSYCDYPESVKNKNELGSAANPDVNAIIETKPELLISMSPIAKKDITAIEAAGTRVWIIAPPETPDELYNCYSSIAAAFGGKLEYEDTAKQALEPVYTALNGANGSLGSFVYIMSTDLAAATNSTFAGNFLSCFGTNLAGDGEKLSLTVEELLELDPEWLILPDYISKYELSEETAALSAVKNNKIVYLNEEVMARIERPTSRLDTAVAEVLECIREAESGEAVTEATEADETAENTEE
ncbi:MAG: ABC transporter substrate-binding protein [Oscillospiraceae bacterium]|nr:ABC transporter substrate-binding protein [Oscillospiraceae bacterium]